MTVICNISYGAVYCADCRYVDMGTPYRQSAIEDAPGIIRLILDKTPLFQSTRRVVKPGFNTICRIQRSRTDVEHINTDDTAWNTPWRYLEFQ